jgi:hypothetical protein
MQLYYSFKNEIESTKDVPLKAKLLNMMLDVVKDKPASKIAKTQRSMLESIKNSLGGFGEKD